MSSYLPCPVCESESARPVISRRGDWVVCGDCGYRVSVNAPTTCSLSDWEGLFIQQWNLHYKRKVVFE